MQTTSRILLSILNLFFLIYGVNGQNAEYVWTLEECIQQALDHNIQLQQMLLTDETNNIRILQAKAARYPSASLSASQNFSWSRDLLPDNTYGSFSAGNNTSVGLSTGVTLYDGFRINNTIRQSELDYKAGQFDTEALKDNLRLNILNAYLQVLYTGEEVTNSRNQMEATSEELNLAEERLMLGAISKSDYLLIKAQLANENLTVTNVENQLAINKITLMQLMEIPVSNPSNLRLVSLDTSIFAYTVLESDTVFETALQMRPEIKSAQLNRQSASLDIDLAKAGLQPSLSLHGSVNTGFSSGLRDIAYYDQLTNKISPALGLSLSVPLYQNRQVRSKVEMANIAVEKAQLNETDVRNQLRKTIEQAYVNVTSAFREYDASAQKYKAQRESFELASEKFDLGLLNSVDFLFEKTNLIVAESNLLQSKYKLIYSIKIFDFYRGKSLTQ